MRKKIKKKTAKKKIFKKKARSTSLGIIPVLFIVAFLALFSETVRTVPAGAFSEKSFKNSFEVPKLNSQSIENKIINKAVLVSNNADYKNTIDKIIIKEENIISKNEIIKKKEPIFIAKVPEKIIEKIDTKILNEEKTKAEIIEIPKVEETIKLAEETENKLLKALDDISEAEGTGTSINNKNITYIQILQNPNDLDLNLKYAQQQGKMGNYKQTISTLERLNMIYPDNVEIKLYLLSVLVQIDSPEKANTIIEEMKLRRDLQAEDLETLKEIEQELEDREPSLWALRLDTGIASVWSNNVNSVSKTGLKKSSDSIDTFASAKHDRTGSGSMGISATRPIGEGSSLLINFSHTTSDQYQEKDDDSQSYGLTFGLDTSLGNQNLSPYIIMSKTDNMTDADAFSFMYGLGGFFSVGERNSISYGYAFTDSKSNHNSEDDTANEANAIGHGFTLGHDFIVNSLISTSIGLGYSDSDAKVDAGNDAETYDFSIGLNFAFPWAFISVSSTHSFNDYKKADSSVVSDIARSDYSNTFSIGLTKAIGDFFPTLDPNRSTFINLGYEHVDSESNIINYDYEADSYSLSFSKSLKLN